MIIAIDILKKPCKMTSNMAIYFKRLMQPPKDSFFLFGPRGIGKTMWARESFPEAHLFDLRDESLYQGFLADVSRFSSELRTLQPGTWVFIDEIQRLPSLLNEVQRFIESGLRFVLTGSSARKLRKGGVNLLAGRALLRFLYPFVPEELGTDFAMEKVLEHGAIPLVWASEEKEETLRAYTELYVKEEIQAEALVRNLPGFARFLPVAALFHGQVINVAGAARDAEVSRATFSGYLGILEDTLMTFRLPAYESRLRVRERKHPKMYWFDPGVVRALRRRSGPVGADEKGALFEGWIASLLMAYRAYRDAFDEWYYWSPAAARETEVDFLLEREGRFIAIETKASPAFHASHLKGLRAVESLPGIVRRMLVCMEGRAMRTEDGIDIWPLRKFLDTLEGGSLW
jgi:predicted AAA+ superfamily ATPase